MGPFEMVAIIVVVSTVGGVASNWLKAKHGYPITDDEGNVIARETGTRGEAHEARIEALEKRLAVLERIATDRGIHTADQIEALRQLDRLDHEQRIRETSN